jgi:hypothetical protein
MGKNEKYLNQYRKILIGMIIGIITLLTSCDYVSEFIRIENNTTFDISISIGETPYGLIRANSVTDYKEFKYGTYYISGDFSGSIEFWGGDGNDHYWTLRINSADNITLVKDY